MTTVEQVAGIRPFHVEVPEETLADLRRRLAATRWPSRELVEDRSQGVQLATIQELARYWMSDYDLRRVESRLNALPQFVTEIDGVDVHFVQVRSPHENALPLIMTHGWLGYDRYVAQGGDVGAGVTDAMGRLAPEGLAGIHTNLLVTALGALDTLPVQTDEERAALAAIKTFQTSGIGYFTEQATRPQTIGYALLDSPVALAAWMLDHDTDAYYKIAGAFVEGQPSGNLTRENILDNITLYWLSGTGASAARSYWEAYGPD